MDRERIDKIKNGLACCAPIDSDGMCTGYDGACKECPYNGLKHCGDVLKRDSLKLINQFEYHFREFTKMIEQLEDMFFPWEV